MKPEHKRQLHFFTLCALRFEQKCGMLVLLHNGLRAEYCYEVNRYDFTYR